MAVKFSNMLPLGTKAPDFKLRDVVSGNMKSLQDLKSEKGTVVMFICNHCPYVKYANPEIVNVANEYIDEGIAFIGINSNDPISHPEDSPEKMKEVAGREQYPFVYLFDETQEVAKQFQAECTPEFYVFNGKLELVYRGQLDDSRPNNDKPLSGKDLRRALDALLAGETIPEEEQKPSQGCNIKWKE